MKLAVAQRLIPLTVEVPSLSYFNIFDLPIWAWRAYAAWIDRVVAERAKQARGQR